LKNTRKDSDYWKIGKDNAIISFILEKRLGVSKGTFENSPEGFKNFTEQAERVVKEAKKNKNVRNVNGKSFYYIDGADKVKKGVAVVVEDGKLQSIMSSNIKSFYKLIESYSMVHQKQLTDAKRLKI
jgi:hypothetical protein